MSQRTWRQAGSFYLIDSLSEPGGQKQTVELLKGFLPRRKVRVRQDLQRLLCRQEARDGRDVVVGEDGQVLE